MSETPCVRVSLWGRYTLNFFGTSWRLTPRRSSDSAFNWQLNFFNFSRSLNQILQHFFSLSSICGWVRFAIVKDNVKFQKFFRDKVKFSSFFTFLSKTQIFRNFEVKTGGGHFWPKVVHKKKNLHIVISLAPEMHLNGQKQRFSNLKMSHSKRGLKPIF